MKAPVFSVQPHLVLLAGFHSVLHAHKWSCTYLSILFLLDSILHHDHCVSSIHGASNGPCEGVKLKKTEVIHGFDYPFKICFNFTTPLKFAVVYECVQTMHVIREGDTNGMPGGPFSDHLFLKYVQSVGRRCAYIAIAVGSLKHQRMLWLVFAGRKCGPTCFAKRPQFAPLHSSREWHFSCMMGTWSSTCLLTVRVPRQIIPFSVPPKTFNCGVGFPRVHPHGTQRGLWA